MNIRQVAKYKVLKTINISASGISLSNINHVKPASLLYQQLHHQVKYLGPSKGQREGKVYLGSPLLLPDRNPLQKSEILFICGYSIIKVCFQ